MLDLDQTRTALLQHGLELDDVRIDLTTGKRFFFFQDPDALPLENYEE